MEEDQLQGNIHFKGGNAVKQQPKPRGEKIKISYNPRQRGRRNPAVLIQWMKDHTEHNPPSREEKIMLASQANMTLVQLADWFSNTKRVIRKITLPVWLKNHPTHSADPNIRPQIQKIFGKNKV